MNTCAPLSVSLPRRTVGVRRRICLTAIRLYVPSASRWQHASPRDSSLAKPRLPVVHSEPAAGGWPGTILQRSAPWTPTRIEALDTCATYNSRAADSCPRWVRWGAPTRPPGAPARRSVAHSPPCPSVGSRRVPTCSASGIRPNVSSSISHSGNASRSSLAICARWVHSGWTSISWATMRVAPAGFRGRRASEGAAEGCVCLCGGGRRCAAVWGLGWAGLGGMSCACVCAFGGAAVPRPHSEAAAYHRVAPQ